MFRQCAVLGVTYMRMASDSHLLYSVHMPTKLWFKRKRYGWGWTPSTWEGWAVIVGYIVLVALFGATIDRDSAPMEVFATFALPVVLLTLTLIRICYRKGEPPRWQWGNEDNDKEE